MTPKMTPERRQAIKDLQNAEDSIRVLERLLARARAEHASARTTYADLLAGRVAETVPVPTIATMFDD